MPLSFYQSFRYPSAIERIYIPKKAEKFLKNSYSRGRCFRNGFMQLVEMPREACLDESAGGRSSGISVICAIHVIPAPSPGGMRVPSPPLVLGQA